MTEMLLGALTFFAFLVLQKAVLEPIATNLGRKMLNRHLPTVARLLDDMLEKYGLDFDPEQVVSDYLDLNEFRPLTEEQKQELIDQIFEEWDLRIATKPS